MLLYLKEMPQFAVTWRKNLSVAHLLTSSPLGIFCSSLKMELSWMRGFALKKWMAGGNWAADISRSFCRCRYAPSFCSAAVRATRPPVCLDASWRMSRSLWAGSGIPSAAPMSPRRSTEVATAWKVEIIFGCRPPRCPRTWSHTLGSSGIWSCKERNSVWDMNEWDLSLCIGSRRGHGGSLQPNW